MVKHLSWLDPDTCGCQIVRWFDDELPNDEKVFFGERMGEIRSGVRLAAELPINATILVLTAAPKRPIFVDDVIKVSDEMMLMAAVNSPTELTVVRGHEGTPQGMRVAHPTIVHQFLYVTHPVGSNVFVRRPCDVHESFTDGVALCGAVLEENNRKNAMTGIIGTLTTIDRKQVWAVVNKPDNGDGNGGWRFDNSNPRRLTFNFAGLLQQAEITAMAESADVQFGPGLVTLERQ